MFSFIVLLILPITITSISTIDPSPVALAKLVADHLTTDPSVQPKFRKWGYAQGIIAEVLVQLSDVMATEGIDYMPWVNARYDDYLTSGQAYNVTHSLPIIEGNALGDLIGLYPFGYLHRAEYYTKYPNRAPTNYTGADLDRSVATIVANTYSLTWNKKWIDGTLSRDDAGPAMVNFSGWTPTGQHEFIWGDDSYMDITLLARLIKAGIGETSKYIDLITKQHILFPSRLVDHEDGLYFHAQNARTNQHSCCKWGRANGWGMMGHVEVLKALNDSHPLFNRILDNFQTHAMAVAKVQSLPDGRWHQLLNDTSTYLETSATAMFLWSFIEGVQHKWLSSDIFIPVITSGWKGLASTITKNGEVNGICTGFGIHPTPNDYKQAKTPYSHAQSGLGTVLRTAAALHSYLQS